MNSKEVSEIRRRFRADKSNINYIRGVFVNEKKEIISEFNQFLGTASEDEIGAILGMIRKTLSGSIGSNLINVPFSTQQVLDSEEHRLLTTLRTSGLKDDDAVHSFFDKAIASIELDGNYLLMLAYDSYDVFAYAKDGEKDDESTQNFSYFICCVCPVKEAKSALAFKLNENRLRNVSDGTVVCPPEFGFMFPAFDDRATNIYSALYYTKDKADSHPAFVSSIFNAPIPMPAAEQKDTFGSVLVETVADECDLHMIKCVNAEVKNIIETHKDNREEEPLVLSKKTIQNILYSAGVGEEHVGQFSEKYDEAFGKNTELPPQNIVSADQLELRTPDVVIKVDPNRGDLVETRIIDGIKYILIRAENDVVVNGINIKIK